ncbi:hypothetical protein [Rhizobium sp. P28RR-XV]|uniref:hypothetical protein n=1 Tax=Rhizobium sp. P28RR-XV TaxID=2726737 RepID=UPI001FEF2890|nr:hypothetical protein [Rhizobium sp. P28RR-XV]
MEFLNTATIRITAEILSLIAEIDEFKGAWRAIGRIAPERLSSLRRVATIESVGSSTHVLKGHASPTERSKSCWQTFAWGHLRHATSKRLPAMRR